MNGEALQQQCELGQEHLVRMDYLEAERILAAAEKQAWRLRDFDTLARLYMPLQEARRQRRQRCGEGVVCLDLISEGPQDRIDPRHVAENYPHGQVLVAGWHSTDTARRVRQLQQELGLYLEVFLAAAYRLPAGLAVVIAPLAETPLPRIEPPSMQQLVQSLPPHCLALQESELPRGSQKGSAQTLALVMSLWERLYQPFLAAADAETDPIGRMEGYRRTIQVDYACELAHQKLSDLAHELARSPQLAAGKA